MIKYLKKAEILRIKENDIVVIKSDNHLSATTTDLLIKTMDNILKKSGFKQVTIAVLPPNLSIGILRKAEKRKIKK